MALFRFLSIQHFHQFASVTVGIVLAGYGFSGLLVYLLGKRGDTFQQPVYYLLSFPAALALSILALYLVNVEPFRILVYPTGVMALTLLILTLTIPFALSGAIVGSSFSSMALSPYRVYALSMGGAGTGVLVWFLLSPLLPIKGILVANILLSLGAIPGKGKGHPIKAPLFLVSIFTAIFVLFSGQPLSEYKGLFQFLHLPGGKVEKKVQSIEGEYLLARSKTLHIFPGLSPRYAGKIPPQVFAFMDGNIIGWRLPPRSPHVEIYGYFPEWAVFLHKGESVLLGGYSMGRYVSMAHDAGFRRVVVSDDRRGFLKLGRSIKAGKENGMVTVPLSPHIYLEESKDMFDVIFIPDIGTLSYSMIGGKVLSENYLLTRECIATAFRHLKEGGIIAFSGWSKSPLREEGKLISLLKDVPDLRGGTPFTETLTLLYGYSRFVLIAAKGEFGKGFLSRLRQFIDKTGFSALIGDTHVTGDYKDSEYMKEAVSMIQGNGSRTPFTLEAPSMNSPYFFRFFKAGKAREVFHALGLSSLLFFESGYLMLAASCTLVFILGVILILIPSIWLMRSLSSRRSEASRLLLLGIASGAGYTLMELIYIGRAPFYLGSYTMGFSIVVLIFLFFSGIGAYLGEIIIGNRYIRFWPATLAMMAVALFPVLTLPSHGILGTLVFLVSSSLVALALGFYLPPVIASSRERAGAEGVVVLWGLNNFASLIGSLVTPLITINFGFYTAYIFASSIYIFYCLLSPSLMEA
jgi:hypothetical protein